MLKTKSQMIMRIAQLREENTLLREQLYNKSETEQALQSALEENQRLFGKVVELGGKDVLCKKYEQALEEIKKIAARFDYWNSSLRSASNVINEIIDITNEIL